MSFAKFGKIFHYHLKKCGGTTLNAWLNNHVSDDKYWDGIMPSRIKNNSELSSSQIQSFIKQKFYINDLVHTHSSWSIFTPPSCLRIVVLRSPINRIISQIADWRREAIISNAAGSPHPLRHIRAAGEMKLIDYLKEFIRVNEFAMILDNYQTRALAALDDSLEPWTYDAAELVGQAIRNLHNIYQIVGITENMDGVRSQIADFLGFPPDPIGIERQNVTGWQLGELVTLDEIERATPLLTELTIYDDIIYREAISRQVKSNYTESDFERFHATHAVKALRPFQEHGFVWFTMRDRQIASGLHGRDAAGTPDCRTWTGPSNRTVFYMPVPVGEQLEVCFRICGYAEDTIRQSIRLEVDDQHVVHRFERESGFADICSVRAISRRSFLKLTIIIENELTSVGTSLESDSRRRGLAIDRYGWRIGD